MRDKVIIWIGLPILMLVLAAVMWIGLLTKG